MKSEEKAENKEGQKGIVQQRTSNSKSSDKTISGYWYCIYCNNREPNAQESLVRALGVMQTEASEVGK